MRKNIIIALILATLTVSGIIIYKMEIQIVPHYITLHGINDDFEVTVVSRGRQVYYKWGGVSHYDEIGNLKIEGKYIGDETLSQDDAISYFYDFGDIGGVGRVSVPKMNGNDFLQISRTDFLMDHTKRYEFSVGINDDLTVIDMEYLP